MDSESLTGFWSSKPFGVEVEASKRCVPSGNEIVGWNIDEWSEDPNVVFSIVNAVLLKVTDQPELLRLLKK